MDKVILDLVSIDQQAQKAVKTAEERSAGEKARIVQEKEALSERYRNKSRREAERIAQRVKESSDREIRRMEAGYQASLRELEQAFHRQEQQWMDEIVKRCRQP